MASKAILQLKGFDKLLEQIQEAGGSVDRSADSCLRQSAQIMQKELKTQMHHRDAIVETMNFAFHTIITSGTILAAAGTLIGMMTSEAAIVGIGQSLGRGTIISIILVMFVLPQILLVGGEIVDKTSFSMPKASLPKITEKGHVRVDGMVRGEIHGFVSGIIRADINGDVDLHLLSGKSLEEGGTNDEA